MEKKNKKGNKKSTRIEPIPFGEFLDSLEGGGPLSSLDRAQEVMFRAMEEPDRLERIRMAHQALGISLDCVDAYILLAQEDTEMVEEAIHLYRKAILAGMEVLGEEAFEKYEGHFWEVSETRPYMRARLGFAACLWEAGGRESAVVEYYEMLVLNPLDNLGVRYLLMPGLIELGRDEEAEELFRCYDEDESAFWTYARVLLDFRVSGDSPRAEASLRNAIESNPHVPGFLTGQCRLPKRIPDNHGFGDRDEAVVYVSENLPAWKASKGAREWLKRKVSKK